MPGKTCLPRKVFPVYHEGSVWMRQAVADILAGVVNHYWPPDRCPDTHLGGLVMELSRPEMLLIRPDAHSRGVTNGPMPMGRFDTREGV